MRCRVCVSVRCVAEADAAYAGLTTGTTLSLAHSDNDVAGVVLSAATLAVTEDAANTADRSSTYTVALSSQPIAIITVAITPSVAGRVSISPSTLMFGPGNFSAPVTVTVTALSDNVDQAAVVAVTLTHAVSAVENPNPVDAVRGHRPLHPALPHRRVRTPMHALGAPLVCCVRPCVWWRAVGQVYAALPAPTVSVSVTDDDGSAVLVSATNSRVVVTEGSATAVSQTFTVRLQSAASSVVVNVQGAFVGAYVSVSPASLTFTSANWNTPQSVVVTALQNPVRLCTLRTAV
jgi:hypothetical protein